MTQSEREDLAVLKSQMVDVRGEIREFNTKMGGVQRSLTDLNIGLNETLNKYIAKTNKLEEEHEKLVVVVQKHGRQIDKISSEILKAGAIVGVVLSVVTFLAPIIIKKVWE